VELLRGGERLDQAVADQSGQFVMVPPRLPAGDYELTLRSRQPDGKQAVSKHSVVVALANDPKMVVANGSAPDQTVRSSQAHQSPEPPLQIAKQQDVAGLQLPHTASATPQSDADSASAVAAPKLATRVVSRGDSLWRISHVTYGAGLRYVVVYKANRDQIRNPNRIYPGQIFVLPAKER
jgi:nucleoid-associated protein YgaU